MKMYKNNNYKSCECEALDITSNLFTRFLLSSSIKAPLPCMQNNSDYYSGEYEIGIPYWIDSFSVFSSLKSSVHCLNTKDEIFSPMDDDRPCFAIISTMRKSTLPDIF